MIETAVVVLLLVANGLFVAAEFALVGAPRSALETRARQGDRLAARIVHVASTPAAQDRYLATAQLGITLASLGLGMYGEHTLAVELEPRLAVLGGAAWISAHTVASIVAVVILTYFHIFVGEMVPKALALTHAEATARRLFLPMRIAHVLFYPFVAALNAVGNGLLRLAGIRRQVNVEERFYTPEELQLIVEESGRGGVLHPDASRLLHELFEFADLEAGDAMVPRVRVTGIPVGATPGDVRKLLETSRHTRYPVFDGDLDHIVGMLHVKDLLRRLLLDEPIGAADVRQMPVIPETTPLDDVLATMQRAQAHLAVVIDEHGGTAGVISLEDLFEEVVGEIDEGLPEAPPLAPQPDGSVRVAGTVRLDELGEHFDVEIEHPDVDSVSGLVLALLDRPAAVGDVVEYGRLRLTVTAVSGHGVREARAWLLPGPM